MNADMLAHICVRSLENEFSLLKYESNKFHVYNPYRTSSTIYQHIIDSIQGLVILVFSIFFPFCPFFFRMKYRIGTQKSRDLRFITSKVIEDNCFYNCIGQINSGERIKLKFQDYPAYLNFIVFFIKKYKGNFWYYRAILKAPEMIAVARLLTDIDMKNVIMSNHYDRWASIVSDICRLNGMNLTLKQHGVVVDIEKNNWKPEKKIHKLDKLLCLDEKSYSFFSEYVCHEVREYEIYSIDIEIVNSISDSSLNVLIIGTGYKDVILKEVEVAKLLSSKFEKINLYIKPHPFFGYKYKELEDFKNISIVDYNPDVDVVIHSGSTLAFQYNQKIENITLIDIGLNEKSIISIISDDIVRLYNE